MLTSGQLCGLFTKSVQEKINKSKRFRDICCHQLKAPGTGICMAMQNLLRGSTAKVNDDNDIDRTPEYKRFIEELAEFHRQRG
jgi:hypothetical protein